MSPSEPPADLMPVADFRQLFESSPELFLVVDASDEHRIVAATDAYLSVTMKQRDAIVGCPIFVVFPDNPDDPSTANHEALRAALARVRQTGEPEAVPVYQYDLPLPGENAGFEKHYWQTSIWPVLAGENAQTGRRPPFLLCRTEDVSRHVVSDEAILDVRSRLEATLGAAEIGTWIWEVGPDRVTADHNLARMFGVSPADAAGGPLEHYTRHIHEEDLPRVQAGIGEAAREGRRFEMEYRIRQPDGSIRWVAARGWAERDEAGNPTRFPGVLIDITDRRRAQTALRESDERLRMAIDQTGLGTFDYDPQTNVLQWSDGCRAIFGVAPDEPVSYETTFARALHPDDHDRTLAAIAEALRPGGEGHYEIEYRVVSALDGQERWVAARGRATFDEAGQPQRFVGTVLDITGRKRSEESALRRSEQLQKLAAISTRLNAAHDVSSVLGIVTEEARVLIGAQQAVASVAAGVPEQGFVTVVSRADKDHPEAAAPPPAITAEMVNDLQGPVRITRAEAERQPDLRLPVESGHPGGGLAAPLIGRSTHRLGVIQLLGKTEDDFTEDDEALLAQLAQIATVAIENARLYEELRLKDKRKDEFLAMLAHELRNPLAAIRNAVALGSDQASAADIEWSMEVINRQMRQLSRLIDDLLDVSRITQGKVQLRKEALDAASVLHSAVEAVRPLMEERQHELTVALRPGTLQMEADPTRLEQIVVNLLANAARYTEKGGEISLRARHEDGKIVIRVRDNGMGIPPEKLPQMFELFAQGDRTLARSEGGLGIGLTLVRSLVEMHGGSVEAFSEGKGKGSEFIVRLPASPVVPGLVPSAGPSRPARESAAVKTAVLPAARVSRRVLVVDDNVDSARGTALILSRNGHEVRVAYDGPSAVTAAQEQRPEFVLLDIGLPGMDGYEVARHLRQDENLAGVKLVAVSGYGQESDRRRSQEAGFDQHLVKPVDPGILLELLR